LLTKADDVEHFWRAANSDTAACANKQALGAMQIVQFLLAVIPAQASRYHLHSICRSVSVDLHSYVIRLHDIERLSDWLGESVAEYLGGGSRPTAATRLAPGQ
jgi:hypothetical protein